MSSRVLSSFEPSELLSLEMSFSSLTVWANIPLTRKEGQRLKDTCCLVCILVNSPHRYGIQDGPPFLPSLDTFGIGSFPRLLPSLVTPPPNSVIRRIQVRTVCRVATCLAQWKQHCYTASNAQCLWQCEMVHHLVVMSICNDRISQVCPVINRVRVTCHSRTDCWFSRRVQQR